MTDFHKLKLSAEQLLKTSRTVTDIDIIDLDAVESLAVLVRSFNDDARLHEAGAGAIQNRLLRMLKNRLRMLRDFSMHPEIADQKIEAPIMISGSFRTGSTKMQRILSESRDFNWLPLWMSINFASETGAPHEDTGSRIADAEEYVGYNSRMSPDLDAAHNHDLFEPDEETFIGNQSFRSPAYFGYAPVSSYLQWLKEQDPAANFKFIRDVLKYLQWQGLADPTKRWLLKSPINLGMEEAVKEAFPDAKFVVTHRLPTQTTASLLSLLEKLYRCHTDTSIDDTRQLATGLAMNLERHMQFRDANPKFPILDIHYSESTTDARTAIRRVYEFAGEPLSDEAFGRMWDWDENNPINKHGSHRYTLKQYGLTAEIITNLCPRYTIFYKERFGHLNDRLRATDRGAVEAAGSP